MIKSPPIPTRAAPGHIRLPKPKVWLFGSSCWASPVKRSGRKTRGSGYDVRYSVIAYQTVSRDNSINMPLVGKDGGAFRESGPDATRYCLL